MNFFFLFSENWWKLSSSTIIFTIYKYQQYFINFFCFFSFCFDVLTMIISIFVIRKVILMMKMRLMTVKIYFSFVCVSCAVVGCRLSGTERIMNNEQKHCYAYVCLFDSAVYVCNVSHVLQKKNNKKKMKIRRVWMLIWFDVKHKLFGGFLNWKTSSNA